VKLRPEPTTQDHLYGMFCHECNEAKPVEDFYIGRRIHRLSFRCRECRVRAREAARRSEARRRARLAAIRAVWEESLKQGEWRWFLPPDHPLHVPWGQPNPPLPEPSG